jgi:hypothetical protein
MLQAGRSRVRFPMKLLDFSIDLISTSNRNESQEYSWRVKGGLSAHKADNLTAISKPII